MTVTVRSFAKINLGLRIGPNRSDGFHELLTVYQTITLHDLVRLRVEKGTGIEIWCEDPRVPRDESNTCFRIVRRALEEFRAKCRVVIEIKKHLPVQGGLGGASSNAVATLLALERALKKTLRRAERSRIAAEIGSDLPLFLIGGTVLGIGRGEQVYPLQELPAIPCVIVTPEIGVSTPKAFAEWDRRQAIESQLLDEHAEGASAQGQKVPKLTVSGSFDRMNGLGFGLSAWLSEQYSGAPFRRGRAENPLLALVRAGIENDFEQVVFPEYPELGRAKAALLRAGAKYASLSGSGSTLYGLFASKAAAVQASVRLRSQGWAAVASSTMTRSAYWKRLLM